MITLAWHALLLFATVFMALRQFTFFLNVAAAVTKYGQVQLRWYFYFHIIITAALITATIMVFA